MQTRSMAKQALEQREAQARAQVQPRSEQPQSAPPQSAPPQPSSSVSTNSVPQKLRAEFLAAFKKKYQNQYQLPAENSDVNYRILIQDENNPEQRKGIHVEHQEKSTRFSILDPSEETYELLVNAAKTVMELAATSEGMQTQYQKFQVTFDLYVDTLSQLKKLKKLAEKNNITIVNFYLEGQRVDPSEALKNMPEKEVASPKKVAPQEEETPLSFSTVRLG